MTNKNKPQRIVDEVPEITDNEFAEFYKLENRMKRHFRKLAYESFVKARKMELNDFTIEKPEEFIKLAKPRFPSLYRRYREEKRKYDSILNGKMADRLDFLESMQRAHTDHEQL